ncbi:MAG: hypothetical protein GY953_42160, partial [bacterium]|nr:hypothetical protein [bacterium]
QARYFYDYYFQPGHRGTPRWVLRLAEFLVAKPDLVFFIDRDADNIYRDKPELTVPEIREQQKRIRCLLSRLPGATALDGDSGVEATVAAAHNAILNHVGVLPSGGPIVRA